MRSHLSRHLTHLTASIVLMSTVGALAGTTGVIAGTTTACGCGVEAATIQFTTPTKAFTMLNQEQAATIVNKSGAQQTVTSIFLKPYTPGGPYFSIPNKNNEKTNCEKSYAAGAKCSFMVKYILKGAAVQENLVMKVTGYVFDPSRTLLGK